MRCLNSPSILNSLETKIVDGASADLRHILVVNAGDGRVARAIRAKVGAGATISVVTILPEQSAWVDDFEGRSSNAWDLEWYAARVKKHGPFDFVVLYQLHEFWHGELAQLLRLFDLAKPGALFWSSFLNAQAQRLITRFLPPARLGFPTLVDPFRCTPSLDFGSWMDFVGRAGGAITDLWGMLDQNAQEFCKKQPDKPVQWESRGVKVSIATFADAFLWGATVVGIAFRTRIDAATLPTPALSFSAYSGTLLQALVVPYPDLQTREGVLASARLEIEAWRKAPASEVGTLARLLLDQMGDAAKPKRILLAGSGWGRELVVLKRKYPKWDWVGFDGNPDLVALGKDLVFDAGASAVSGNISAALPFADRAFDGVLSLGYLSSLYEGAARGVAKELRRVSSGGIYHLEDGRGPDQSMQLKSFSLKAVYSDIGCNSTVQPVLVDGSPNGMYMLTVAAPV